MVYIQTAVIFGYNDKTRVANLLHVSAVLREVSISLLTPTIPQCALIHGDTENHRRHRDISVKTEMVFRGRCLFAIQVTIVAVYSLHYAFEIV